jgi:hypothetical protein
LTGEELARGLEGAFAIEAEGARAEALAALAPQLSGEMLEQGLEAALAIGDGWSRAIVLAALAPQLAGEELARALEGALAIEVEGARAQALAALSPQFSDKARTQALDGALDTAPAAECEGDQVLVFSRATQLTGASLAAALTSGDEGDRAVALARFLPVAHDPATLRSVRQASANHLQTLFAAKRGEVLQFCAEEKLIAPPILDQDTLAAIAGHIVEVCEEWRWM